MMYVKSQQSVSVAHVERLENRMFLAGDIAIAAVTPPARIEPFSLRVNFGPASTPRVKGYRADFGAVYGRRSNGFTYGWNTSRIANAVYLDDARYDSSKAESNILMTRTSNWNVKMPNGWYEVRVLMGDPNVSLNQADYRINVEGKPLVKGSPYKGFPWVEGLAIVHLTDGKLTISSADRAINNRICSIAISPTDPPAVYSKGANINWSTTSIRSPVYRAEAGSVRVGNRLFVMGGFRNQYTQVTGRVDILNLKTNTWSRGAPLPGAQTHFGAASDGTFIYLVAGQYGPDLSINGTNQAWKYDITNNKWSKFIDLPAVRFGGQLSLVNGRLHFVGGDDRSRVRAKSDHWILDLGRQSKGWFIAAPLPTPTDHHAQIVVNNQLYVVGGEVEHGTSYLQNRGLYRYDDTRNRWTILAPLPEGASHSEASTLTDGKRIFVIAGQVNAQQLTSQVRSYDIANNRWQTHTSLPTARKAGIAWIIGNKLYYTTGDDEVAGETRSTYVGVIG